MNGVGRGPLRLESIHDLTKEALLETIDVYLYGMTLLSHIYLLKGPYPEADTYQEIQESFVVPGGETANAVILLSHFGLKVKVDGSFLGVKTREEILDSFRHHGVDASLLKMDEHYDGVEDFVLVGGKTRTVFGTFQRYFSDPIRRWSMPDRDSIRSARVVSLDPYFREASLQTARWCVEEGKPTVVIDCPPDDFLHQHAAYSVLSAEYLKQTFPGLDRFEVLKCYTQSSEGWVVLTAGSRDVLYSRKGMEPRTCRPYPVEVKGTLGAGDSFRAGVVYGLHQGWDADKTVRFAAATAAKVCMKFPVAADPPSLDEVLDRMKKA
jgi:sugar/nucleoside kinase (ribokinase family)